jgi:hypothetical protein
MFERFRPKAPKPCIRAVNVYLPLEGADALVVLVDEQDGAWVERPGGGVRLSAPDLQQLGAAVKGAFVQSQRREGPIQGIKRSEWPAYQASGVKTLKAFERDWVAHTLHGANTANIIMEVRSPPFANEVSLTSSINPLLEDETVGRWLRDFHAFFVQIQRSMGPIAP